MTIEDYTIVLILLPCSRGKENFQSSTDKGKKCRLDLIRFVCPELVNLNTALNHIMKPSNAHHKFWLRTWEQRIGFKSYT